MTCWLKSDRGSSVARPHSLGRYEGLSEALSSLTKALRESRENVLIGTKKGQSPPISAPPFLKSPNDIR
jgi:hypothetical protein